MRFRMFLKFVRVPPIHRPAAYGAPARSAAALTISATSFLPPTKRTCLPDDAEDAANAHAASRRTCVPSRSKISVLSLVPKRWDVAVGWRHARGQPKCAPASHSVLISVVDMPRDTSRNAPPAQELRIK